MEIVRSLIFMCLALWNFYFRKGYMGCFPKNPSVPSQVRPSAKRLALNRTVRIVVPLKFPGNKHDLPYRGFLKWWYSYPTTRGFRTKNDHDFRCEMGVFQPLRKHCYISGSYFPCISMLGNETSKHKYDIHVVDVFLEK